MKIVRVGILLSLALGVGCAHLQRDTQGGPSSQGKVQDGDTRQGDVLVSVVSVAPWHAHVAELRPGFSSTGEQALGKVLPTTRVVRQSDALGASGARSTAIAIGNDTQAAIPEAEPPPIELGGVSAPTEGLGGLDPFLVYGSATALHQEIVMLNRYVEDAATRRNSVPYLVRLQITHMPNRPNRAVDTYVTLRFGGNDAIGDKFPETDEGEEQGILVLPLIATESLENSLVEKTFELQLAAALAEQVSVAPFKPKKTGPTISMAGAQKLRAAYKRARASLGRDLNSTFVVGAEDSNIIKVRIGATNGGSKGLQMVPRNHYVSVLVMVPTESLEDNEGYQPSFINDAYACSTETTDPHAAVACKSESISQPSKKEEKRKQALSSPGWNQWSLSVTPAIEYRRRWRKGDIPFTSSAGLSTEVSLPPWWNFHMALCTPHWHGRFAGMEDFGGCMFEEPVTLLDDGKKTEIVVPGVKIAAPESISVVVYMRAECGEAEQKFFPIRSTQVAWSRSSSLVRATFPSLSKLQLPELSSSETATKIPCKEHEVPDYVVALYAGEPRWDQSQFKGNDALRNIVLMSRVHYRRIEETPPEFPIAVAHGADHLVIDDDGRGHAIVVIGKADPPREQPKEVLLTVKGADLAGATLLDPPGGSAQLADKGAALSLAKPGTWRLEFANASPNQPITVTLAAGKAKAEWDYDVQRNPTVRTPAR